MAKPQTVEELQALILEANDKGTTLEIRGGGSKALIGRPEPADDLLDMTAFSGVIDYDPAELVLTCGAGTPLKEIQTLVAANGQMLPFEPFDYDLLLGGPQHRSTMGGVLAANVSGPRRVTAGSARDHFLGFEAVSGRGEIFKAGGRVVKNVTGYDLPKLLAGSWGTLAALTTVTIKVLPRPRSSASLSIKGLTDREACAAMSAAIASSAPVTAACHSDDQDGVGATMLRLEGVEPAVEAGMAKLQSLFGGGPVEESYSQLFWRSWAEVATWAPPDRLLWRVSVPPADGWRFPEALSDIGAFWFYDWAGGLVWLMVDDNDDAHAERVRAAAAWLGGHATLIRAHEAVRAAVPTFQPESPALAALSARVKAAFDPQGVLGPRHRIGG